MMEDNQRPRFRFRLGTLLLIVAILALLLVTVIQQVQINRQQTQINQMRLELDRNTMDRIKFQEIIRELRDHLDRAGSSSDGRHR
jgi:cytochrome c-type biogenesis protein CcmH/NrfG